MTHHAPVVENSAARMANAKEWAEEWSKSHRKPIVELRAGDGKLAFSVLHVGPDAMVLDLGRTITLVPLPLAASQLQAGAKVAIGEQMEVILLQQKARSDGLER